jgi:NAD(P)H-dependent flavin oxidoreductase YrpB (nitropropane dioxygenase family)
LENFAAGGHNAPPRNRESFGPADDIESYFDKVLALDVPIYVAGAFKHGGTRTDFEEWVARGAHGLQVGSRFALCEESGMRADLRAEMIEQGARGKLQVTTSPLASPTGYPIKIAHVSDTIAEPDVYAARKRICDKKYLLQSHFQEQADGTKKEVYICSAMPFEEYARLGGDVENAKDRVCLCNGLLSTAGYYADVEPPVVTLGMSGKQVKEALTAREIVEDILTPEFVAEQEQQLVAS